MKCEKCGNIIDDNMIRCPYCGNTINGDFFGYENSVKQQQINASNPPKKDNSTKVVFIILGCIMGLFAIIAMFVLLLSGSGSNQNNSIDGAFSITPDFEFCITDNNPGTEYTVKIKNTTDISQKSTDYLLMSGQVTVFNLTEGSYTIKVMKSISDMINLNVTVDKNCQYNTATLEYDSKQLKTTNEGEISTSTANDTSTEPEQRYFAISGLVHERDGEAMHSYEFDYSTPLKVSFLRESYMSDGTSCVGDFTYDKDGSLLSYREEYENYTNFTSFDYDLNGNLIHHGNGRYTTEFKYDSDQRMIERSYTEGGGYSKYTFEYNNADDKADSVQFRCSDSSLNRNIEIEYDNNGNIANINQFDVGFSNTGHNVGKENYKYDSNNRLVYEYQEESYYEFSSFEEENEYSNDLLTKSKSVFTAEEDSITYEYTYSYNSDNLIESIAINTINSALPAENHTSKVTCKYDDYGNLIEYVSSRTYSSGTVTDTIKYEYVEVDAVTSDIVDFCLDCYHTNDDQEEVFGSEFGSDFDPLAGNSYMSVFDLSERANYVF